MKKVLDNVFRNNFEDIITELPNSDSQYSHATVNFIITYFSVTPSTLTRLLKPPIFTRILGFTFWTKRRNTATFSNLDVYSKQKIKSKSLISDTEIHQQY